MNIVSIVGQKGGTGKTTLAQCLAVAASQDGLSVLILDLDPQANTANWYDRRQNKESPLVATAPPGRLTQAVEAARSSGLDLVLIDTPGKLEGAALAAVEIATPGAYPRATANQRSRNAPGDKKAVAQRRRSPGACCSLRRADRGAAPRRGNRVHQAAGHSGMPGSAVATGCLRRRADPWPGCAGV